MDITCRVQGCASSAKSMAACIVLPPQIASAKYVSRISATILTRVTSATLSVEMDLWPGKRDATITIPTPTMAVRAAV